MTSSKRLRSDNHKSDNESLLEELLFGKDIVHSVTAKDTQSNESIAIKSTHAKWVDEDDESLEVDLASKSRLKKLIKFDQSKVSGTEYSTLLQERFKTRKLDWAQVDDNMSTGDDDLLRQSSSMLGRRGQGSSDCLQFGKIDIMRLTDANIAEPSKEKISAIQFHASGSVLLTAGTDKYLRFYKVDGDKNEKISSTRFSDMSISTARFLGTSSEVVLAGRKPYFFSYDTESGAVTRIPGLMGRGLKSHENMSVSPDGSWVGFVGASGYAHLCSGRHKTWAMDIKMNCKMKAMAFADEHTLVTSGVDADVYVWDLRATGNARCLHRFAHSDGTCTSALAAVKPTGASGGAGYLAVGAESGVVSVFEGGLGKLTAAGEGGGSVAPAMMKSVMNLTTEITAAQFHPSGQILAIASREKVDQLRLVHLPSLKVFSNWPTERTPLRRVECMDFSPGGGYFAVGNNVGRVLLYRLNHFQNA